MNRGVCVILERFMWVCIHHIKWPKYYITQMHWAVDLLWAGGRLTTWDTFILGTKIAICHWTGITTTLFCASPPPPPTVTKICTASCTRRLPPTQKYIRKSFSTSCFVCLPCWSFVIPCYVFLKQQKLCLMGLKGRSTQPKLEKKTYFLFYADTFDFISPSSAKLYLTPSWYHGHQWNLDCGVHSTEEWHLKNQQQYIFRETVSLFRLDNPQNFLLTVFRGSIS